MRGGGARGPGVRRKDRHLPQDWGLPGPTGYKTCNKYHVGIVIIPTLSHPSGFSFQYFLSLL